MSNFQKNRTRVIIFGSSSQINLVTLYCHVIILGAEGFGLEYNVEMSQLKIIPVFFLVSKGLFAHLYFYSYWWSRRFPFSVFKSEMTHPHPFRRHQQSKDSPQRDTHRLLGDSSAILSSCDLDDKTQFSIGLCHRQPNDDCNTKYHCQAPALFYFLQAKLCLIVQSIPIYEQCSLPMMDALKVSDH